MRRKYVIITTRHAQLSTENTQGHIRCGMLTQKISISALRVTASYGQVALPPSLST